MKTTPILRTAGISLISAVCLTVNTAFAETFEPVGVVVKSAQEAVLSEDLNARVVETPVMTGEAILKDDVLLKFD